MKTSSEWCECGSVCAACGFAFTQGEERLHTAYYGKLVVVCASCISAARTYDALTANKGMW